MGSVSSAIDNDFIAYKSNPSTFIFSSFGNITIDEERNLVCIGRNVKGFLGHEEINKIIITPKVIPNLNDIEMVDCRFNHTVCIDYDGNLFTFGDNEKGQLGIGKDKQLLSFTSIPQKIINIPKIDIISCGYSFTVCITNDRIAYSFGSNRYGQLGIGSNTDSYSLPQLIPDLNDIEFVSCGGNHVICKTYSNEYYSWGFNYYGQLGQGNDNISSKKPTKCSNWPNDIVDIKTGSDNTLLLTSKGYLYSFGCNFNGQLGLKYKNIKQINIPTLIKHIPLIKRIECGHDHSMCVDSDDNLWVFGYNKYGQLGLGDNGDKFKPTLNESLHDIIDISSGGSHTFIKTINNEIYAFGNNEYSQLGIQTEKEYQLTPIQVFEDKEDIWVSSTRRSKQKSARK